MSKTRLLRSGDQPSLDTFIRKENTDTLSPSNQEIRDMFENLKRSQDSIKTSIESNKKDDDSRQLKNEKMIETMGENMNKLTENINQILPKIGQIETRLTTVESKLDSVPEIEKAMETIEDVEQALPRIGSIEDRLTHIESMLETRVKDQRRMKDPEVKALWVELERKRQNLIVYGLEGSESPEQSVEIAKTFMMENLKLDPEWVQQLHLKAANRLQGNGKSPLPLKISFMWPEERDKCLRAGFNLKGSKLSLRTDLPKAMRVERAKLANQGYEMMKRGEVFAKKIKEKGISVYLLVKDNEGDNWRTITQNE